MIATVVSLVRKEILLEFRQKYTLAGLLIYLGATVFLIYMLHGQPEARTWNALFWTVQLFVTINTVAKSFLQESAERLRYYYQLVPPAAFFLGKICYSLLLMAAISLISVLLFTVVLGSPLQQSGLFLALSVLGGVSLSCVFTFLSAVAAVSGQNASIMAILGLPLVTPVLLILSNLALKTLAGVYVQGWSSLALMLAGLDALIVVLGLVLFPFLWKE